VLVYLIPPGCILYNRGGFKFLSYAIRGHTVVLSVINGREEDGLAFKKGHEASFNILF
jgi:hypothetical protein